MKVTQHVEHLLRQGHKPKELIELGFPKRVVTKVRRRLKEEKAAGETKAPEETAQGKTDPKSLLDSPERIAAVEQKLQSMARDMQKVDSLIKSLSDVATLIAVTQHLGTFKREVCPYEKNGLCTLETWSSEGEVPKGIGEPTYVDDKDPGWYVKPSALYCAMCSALLENHIDDVGDKLSGDPLAGAEYQFTCNGCGSKGWVAAKIKCTKCGYETYRGWWPKKE